MLTPTWFEDVKLEQDLRRFGVSFEIESIPFSKIDLRESQINGARIGSPLVRNLIDDYKTAFTNGDSFPRVVCYKAATGYVLLGGNQRSQAIAELIEEGQIERGIEVEAYLLPGIDKVLREVISRTANVAHGGRTEAVERIAHAIYCVKRLGITIADAAKNFMVAESTISRHIRAEEQRTLLMRSGINATTMPMASLEPLSALDGDENSKIKIAKIAQQHNATGDTVATMVASVKKERSPSARVNRIREFEKSFGEQKKATANGHAEKKISRPRRDRIVTLLDAISTFLETGNDGSPFKTLEELQFKGGDDTKRIRDLANKIAIRFKVLGL